MNQVTREFEEIQTEEAEREAENKGWPIFRVGEVIRIRGGHFEVERVTRNRLILKPLDRLSHIEALRRELEAIKAGGT